MAHIVSSVIKEAVHQEEKQEMFIKFVSDKVYRYLEVPRSIYEELLKAESAGSFFNERIKGKFPAQLVERIPGEESQAPANVVTAMAEANIFYKSLQAHILVKGGKEFSWNELAGMTLDEFWTKIAQNGIKLKVMSMEE
jgi:hypothetical protein